MNAVIEQQNHAQQALVEQLTSQPIKFNVTEAALTELNQTMVEVTASDPKNAAPKAVKAVRAVVANCRNIRSGVNKMHRGIADPIVKYKRDLDGEKRRVNGRVEDIEVVGKAWISAYETEKERQNQERIRREQERVDNIKKMIDTQFGSQMILNLQGESSDKIDQVLADIEAIDITDSVYQEFTNQAANAKIDALINLNKLHENTLEREAAEAERKRLEAEARAKEEQLRKEREEMERQKAEVARQQAEMKRQQDELERKQREAEAEANRLRQEEEKRQQRTAEALAKEREEARAKVLEEEQRIAEQEALAAQETVEETKVVVQNGNDVDHSNDLEEAPPKMISIPYDTYQELARKAAMYDALSAAGVDNWSGYDEAMDRFIEE